MSPARVMVRVVIVVGVVLVVVAGLITVLIDKIVEVVRFFLGTVLGGV